MQIFRKKDLIQAMLVVGIVAFLSFVPLVKALAQSSSSAVTGNVADVTGAKIQGARVVLTSVDTNVVRATASNSVGDYNFVSVPPGNYTLSISAPSFQAQKFSAFQVAVDQTVNLNAENFCA